MNLCSDNIRGGSLQGQDKPRLAGSVLLFENRQCCALPEHRDLEKGWPKYAFKLFPAINHFYSHFAFPSLLTSRFSLVIEREGRRVWSWVGYKPNDVRIVPKIEIMTLIVINCLWSGAVFFAPNFPFFFVALSSLSKAIGLIWWGKFCLELFPGSFSAIISF